MHRASILLCFLLACGPDGRDDDASPTCELVGSWSGVVPSSSTFAGSSLFLDFADDGGGHFRMGESEESPLQTDTAWELADSELVLSDAERIGVFYGCDPAEEGRYRVRFADDCGGLELELVRDDCDARGDVLDGARLSTP